MKLIQEIGPFFALKVYIKVVFEQKGPPSTAKSTLHVYWFFKKNPTSTIIPTSTFIDFATFASPPRLFQPPRLLEIWEYVIVCFVII